MPVAVGRRRSVTITREETAVVANVGGDGGAPVLIPLPKVVSVPYKLTLSSCPKTLHPCTMA